MKKILLALFFLLCSAGLAGAATPPTVVVSIKPIHALVAGITQGVAEPRLLVSGARTGVLDPLGSKLPAGPESYFQLLNNLAESLRTGLHD